MTGLEQLVEWLEKQKNEVAHSQDMFDNGWRNCADGVLSKARAILAAEQKPTADKGLVERVAEFSSWLKLQRDFYAPSDEDFTCGKHEAFESAYSKLGDMLSSSHNPAPTEEPLAICGEGHPCPEKIRRVFELAEYESLPELADRKGYGVEIDKGGSRIWTVGLISLHIDAKYWEVESADYFNAEQAARNYLTALPDKVAEKKGGAK